MTFFFSFFPATTVLKRAACQEWILVVIRNSSLPELVKGFHLQGCEVLAGEMTRGLDPVSLKSSQRTVWVWLILFKNNLH